MLANLQQIPLWQWLIIIVVILGITWTMVWFRRKRMKVTKVEVTTGILKTTLEPDKSQEPVPPTTQPEGYSVNVSGNKMFGNNKIKVRREKTNVQDNLMAGENEIEVGAKPGPKPKGKKGI